MSCHMFTPTLVAVFGKGGILHLPFRKTRVHIAALTLEQMCCLFHLKRVSVTFFCSKWHNYIITISEHKSGRRQTHGELVFCQGQKLFFGHKCDVARTDRHFPTCSWSIFFLIQVANETTSYVTFVWSCNVALWNISHAPALRSQLVHLHSHQFASANHRIKATSTYSYDCCIWISLKTRSSPQVLQLPHTIQRLAKKVWLSGYSKFPLGVSVSVNRCLSLYVSPVMNWQLIQGVPPLLPSVSRDWPQPPQWPWKG